MEDTAENKLLNIFVNFAQITPRSCTNYPMGRFHYRGDPTGAYHSPHGGYPLLPFWVLRAPVCVAPMVPIQGWN